MAAAPTYATYVANGGKLAEGSFDAALPQASSLVDAAIWPNVVADTTLAAYQRAVCAVVDVVDAGDVAGVVVSESLGKAQLTFADANVSAMAGLSAHPVGRAILAHLTGTGLLYRGI